MTKSNSTWNKKRVSRKRGKSLPWNPLEIKNIERLIEDIYNRREAKIVNQAVLAARTGLEPANIHEKEKEFFMSIVKMLKKERRFIEDFIDKPYMKKEIVVEEFKKTDSLQHVELLEDIPEFMGIDLKKYGPYNKGDKILIPKDNALLFINAEKAKLAREKEGE